MPTPEIIINLKKIASNVRELKELYEAKGVNITGVTKGVGGDPHVANVLVNSGVNFLADSRISNIRNMRNAGIKAKFLLLRTVPSEVDLTVEFADISLNSDLIVIQMLSQAAKKRNTTHQIILMVELGDLREGIMPIDLNSIVRIILKLPGIKLAGIGTNLACFGGIQPNARKMRLLSSIAGDLERRFKITLALISGGNSANYNWFRKSEVLGRINNLRLGESIFLGCETLENKAIPNLYTDAFYLSAEVIESSTKPSLPYGEQGLDAFGNKPLFKDSGQIQRAILALGLLDVRTEGLIPPNQITILGASSDHLILNTDKIILKVGELVRFGLNYGALLSAMNSKTITKRYVQTSDDQRVLQKGRGKRSTSQTAFSISRD